MSCEDYPCCGHEPGCCPDYDESGRQLNMVCTCGKKLPLSNRSSLCDSCLRSGDDHYGDEDWYDGDDDSRYDSDEDYDDRDDGFEGDDEY